MHRPPVRARSGGTPARALPARLPVPNAGRALRRLLAALYGGLLPCPGCGARPAGHEGLCRWCRWRALQPGGDGAHVWLGSYAGPLGRAVRALKYRGATRVSRWLGRSLARQVAESGWRPELVCGVPLHPVRTRQRGYNQAALLACHLAAVLAVPCADALARTRATPPQARLRRSQRAANVAGAFRAHPALVAGRRVLLVDDVLTTGATVRACRSALLAAGAREVRVAVVARAESGRSSDAAGPAVSAGGSANRAPREPGAPAVSR